MIGKLADRLLSKPGAYLASNAGITRFGLDNSMHLARAYNRLRYFQRARRHHKALRHELPALLSENGAAEFPPKLRLNDGWVIDESRTLPHLDRLLEQGTAIIEERAGHKHSDTQYPFLRNLLVPSDLTAYPALLDFITSSALLSTVMDYLGTIPMLSKARPPGVRFMESNIKLDPDSHLPPRDSQLYHIDFYDSPQVYVIVLMKDVTLQSGPWTFLPASVSARVARDIGYRRRGHGYRVSDEEMYRHIDKSQEIVFAYPKGTVLFIDSSRCFHFGSRDAHDPRFMLMYTLQSPCRTDFAYTYSEKMHFPLAADASRLRRMVLK